jgi:hypothetical protein
MRELVARVKEVSGRSEDTVCSALRGSRYDPDRAVARLWEDHPPEVATPSKPAPAPEPAPLPASPRTIAEAAAKGGDGLKLGRLRSVFEALAPQEKDVVRRLADRYEDAVTVLQYFVACDKDEAATAGMLAMALG